MFIERVTLSERKWVKVEILLICHQCGWFECERERRGDQYILHVSLCMRSSEWYLGDK